ncbi:DNA adenine methylase [Clostridium thermarum]|uniref:DNA adenine methylase n=1 Tax=Clostridium thermarum TaxID=1716543 RepID=UPI001124B917|nr:DNA adenine methylase [Clostridium thermarum]
MRSNGKPFLKWAGGKTQLLDQFDNLYPKRLKEHKLKKYVEPFIGGGAVFFELNSRYDFESVVLNDINSEVILTYKVIRDKVDDIIDFLSKICSDFISLDGLDKKAEFYYKVREEFNHEKNEIDYEKVSSNSVKHAGKMIFLNKTCFNGLYRLNRKGCFNVPFNKSNSPSIFDEDNLKEVSKALQNVILLQGDFEVVTDYIDKDTFVYIDPPYRPLNATSNFTDYSKEPFNDDSQRRLVQWFRKLSDKGAAVMLSNSDPKNIDENDEFFDDLYKDFYIERVSASRAINSKGAGRGKISELLIRSEK